MSAATELVGPKWNLGGHRQRDTPQETSAEDAPFMNRELALAQRKSGCRFLPCPTCTCWVIEWFLYIFVVVNAGAMEGAHHEWKFSNLMVVTYMETIWGTQIALERKQPPRSITTLSRTRRHVKGRSSFARPIKGVSPDNQHWISNKKYKWTWHTWRIDKVVIVWNCVPGLTPGLSLKVQTARKAGTTCLQHRHPQSPPSPMCHLALPQVSIAHKHRKRHQLKLKKFLSLGFKTVLEN